MTEVGAGGVIITGWVPSSRFSREYRKLAPALQDRVDEKLDHLQKNPRPPGLGFEKLKGYAKPDVYSVHITGNYKLTMELRNGTTAWLRRVAVHDEIDRCP